MSAFEASHGNGEGQSGGATDGVVSMQELKDGAYPPRIGSAALHLI